MKFSILRMALTALMAVGVAGATGCSTGGGQDQNQNQVNQNGNQNQVSYDATVSYDSAVQPDSGTNHGSCDRNQLTPTAELASTTDYGLTYEGHTSTSPPDDIFSVQIYSSWNGPTTPGTYSLDGINYADCGLCLLIYQGCTTTECAKTFYADAGSVEITSIGVEGDTFAATLHDVVFKEVTIDSSTYQSTPVPGGETWCMDGYNYSETIEDHNAGMCGQPGVTCVGETVNDFQLMNCETGQMESMNDWGNGQKALWFVGTHGWCPACHEFVPQVLQAYDQQHANGLQVAIVLGEDDQHNQPSLSYCQHYADQYNHGRTLFFMDHDGQYPHATLFQNLYPYPDQSQSIGFPWSGVVDPRNHQYAYADGAGGDLQTTLNQLLSAP